LVDFRFDLDGNEHSLKNLGIIAALTKTGIELHGIKNVVLEVEKHLFTFIKEKIDPVSFTFVFSKPYAPFLIKYLKFSQDLPEFEKYKNDLREKHKLKNLQISFV